MMKTRNQLLLILLLMLLNRAYAIEEPIMHSHEYEYGSGSVDISIEPNTEQPEETTSIGFMDYSRDWLADYIDSVSYNVDGFFIDTFFGDDVIDDDVKGSRAKLSFFTRREIGQPVDYNYGLSVKLVLPNTNERFNLIFESSEEEEGNRDNDPLQSVENVEYSTAIRYIVKETDQWSAKLDTGVKWGLPPDPFSRFRLRRNIYFDDMRLRATQTLFWSALDGFGEDTSLELNKPLNLDRLMRYSVGARYMLDNEFFELRYGLSLFHELNSKEVLAYYFRASGDTEVDATFNNYGVGIRYRRKLYQDWIFGEVNPELETASENEYDVTPIIMFRLEALVGG